MDAHEFAESIVDELLAALVLPLSAEAVETLAMSEDELAAALAELRARDGD